MPSFIFNSRQPSTPDILNAKSTIGGIEINTNVWPPNSNEIIEIWASNTNNRLAANRIGVTDTGTFFHILDDNSTRYYWVKTLFVNTSGSSEFYPAAVSAGVSANSKLVSQNDINFTIETGFQTAAGAFANTGTNFPSVYNAWVTAAGGEFIATSTESHIFNFNIGTNQISFNTTGDYIRLEAKVDVYQSSLSTITTKGPFTLYFNENNIVKFSYPELVLNLNNWFGLDNFTPTFSGKRRCILKLRKARGSSATLQTDLNYVSVKVKQI